MEFNIDAFVEEVTGGADSTSTVRIANGDVSKATGKSGL